MLTIVTNRSRRLWEFVPAETAISEAIENLSRQRGGGKRTPDDMRFLANKRKWKEEVDSPAFRFWQAVHDAI